MGWRTLSQMEPCWQLYLFEGPRLVGQSAEQRRYRSQRVAALLAYLGLRLGRDVPREELLEALWPDEDPKITANRLRFSLSELRRQLEPEGVEPNSVLDATRTGYVRLRSETVWCDVAALEVARRRGDLAEAAWLGTGTLLPGFYDDWILTERERFAALKDDLPEPAQPTRLEPVGLPDYLTRFFGRERELAGLLARLETARLVTLTGPGGMGKTRLSRELGRRWQESGRGPAVFVPLAELMEPSGLGRQVLEALQLPEPTGGDILTAIKNAVGASALLLILDNFEQLVAGGGGEFVRQLLAALPGARCLITSRRILDLPGEAEFPLQSLPLADAMALLSDRLSAVRTDFQPAGYQTDLEALCHDLEGMPLALELASSRFRLYSLSELRQGLAVLERPGGRRISKERHGSMSAAIAWSWNLLTPERQRLFAALSLFRGGWTIATAAELFAEPGVAEGIESLLMDSLVFRLPGEGGPERFSMLEPLREFAAEKRLKLPDNAALERRFVERFLALTASGASPDTDDSRDLAPLTREWRNIEVALELAREHGLLALGATALLDLRPFWQRTGRKREGLAAVQRYFDHPEYGDLDQTWRCSLTVLASSLAFHLGKSALALEAAALARELAWSLSATHRAEALRNFCLVSLMMGHTESALALFPELKAASESALESDLRLRLTFVLALLLNYTKDYTGLKAVCDRGIALAQNANLEQSRASLLFMRGCACFNQGELEQAEEAHFAALQSFWERKDRTWLPFALENISDLRLAQQRPVEALTLFAAAQRIRHEDGFITYTLDESARDSKEHQLRALLSALEYEAAWSRGWETPLENLSISEL